MPDPIALVTRLDRAEEEAWLAALAAAMPDETFVPFRALEPARYGDVRIAVVANPEPADVARLANLAFVQSLWAGVERLVADLGPDAPPIVRMTDPELARTMAEAALAWTLYLQRDMPAYADQQRRRVWRQRPYRKPADVTVGLLGLGALGLAAARTMVRAGFRVVGWSRRPKELVGVETCSGEAGLADLLARSDIVVCLIPLTPATRGLLDAGRLAGVKRGAALINFARGPIVVEADLLAALDSGSLHHAVLDVFDAEPLPASSPLWSRPDVTVLPHVSAPTAHRSAAEVVGRNVRRFRREGRVPDAVDMGRGY